MSTHNINLKTNFVEMLILHLLHEDDYYGYQITQLIKERSNNVLVIPEGSLYPTLYKLVDKGFISDIKKQVGKRQVRVYYHLEMTGREQLKKLLDDYNKITKGLQDILTFQN